MLDIGQHIHWWLWFCPTLKSNTTLSCVPSRCVWFLILLTFRLSNFFMVFVMKYSNWTIESCSREDFLLSRDLIVPLSLCLWDDRDRRRGEGVSCFKGGGVRTLPRGLPPQIPAVVDLRPEQLVHRGLLPPCRAPRRVRLPSALAFHKLRDLSVSAGR